MSNSKIKGFFYHGNAVHGEPDYGLADNFVRTAEAFANATYQSVYIIDYFRKNFLYVSPNPLFLCGISAEAVKELGYQFYIDHVPDDEVDMLLEINKAGFSFFNDVPLEEKRKYTISYDFHLVNGREKILINHKLTALACQSDGSVWLGLSIVSLSSHSDAGHVIMHCRDKSEYWEYDLSGHTWEKHSAPVLNETEKAIITLSSQGLTINAIAERVHLAADSVKTARRRLYVKLGVSNITEAISYATNYKLV
ncbi:MAG: LuxR C-terminal-related transcriptional regulator [Muribaculaceae bacterium]|nr:LuxR C-terminal-related transcriptional regulator [Muribaculaceae bacterium]